MIGRPLRAILSFAILALLTAAGFAQQPPQTKVDNPDALAAIKKYDNDRAKLEKAYKEYVEDLNKKFRAATQEYKNTLKDALEEARRVATKDDKLDEAILLRDMAEAVDKFDVEPPGTDSQPTKQPTASKPSDNADTKPKMNSEAPTIQELKDFLAGTWKSTNGWNWVINRDGSFTNDSREKGWRSGKFVFTTNDEAKQVEVICLLSDGKGFRLMAIQDPNTIVHEQYFSMKRSQQKQPRS